MLFTLKTTIRNGRETSSHECQVTTQSETDAFGPFVCDSVSENGKHKQQRKKLLNTIEIEENNLGRKYRQLHRFFNRQEKEMENHSASGPRGRGAMLKDATVSRQVLSGVPRGRGAVFKDAQVSRQVLS
ncbi:uncharacterized protein LOC122267330, partial [Penaeus japonicus]|uniref:uncharacterized protein LOC122267330 n=1 Tax=Penaeus japonicus TaxID=27405 RepID=UPI001C711F5B